MFYPNQPNYGNGYGYVTRAQAKNTQPLTAEQIAYLQNNVEPLDVKVSQLDALIAQCTHKARDTGASTLVMDGDDTCHCTICHQKFHLRDWKEADVQKAVDDITDLMQSAKALYLDAPEELIQKYFQMIPLLQKFPKIYNRAVENFAKYDGFQQAAVNPQWGGWYSGFDAVSQMLSNPTMMGGQPMYQGGMYNAGPNVPGMGMYPNAQMGGYPQQMPQQAPGFVPGAMPMGGYPQQMAPAPGVMPPMGNPFGIPGQPMGGYPQQMAQQAPPAPMPGEIPGQAPQAPAGTEAQSNQVFHA